MKNNILLIISLFILFSISLYTNFNYMRPVIIEFQSERSNFRVKDIDGCKNSSEIEMETPTDDSETILISGEIEPIILNPKYFRTRHKPQYTVDSYSEREKNVLNFLFIIKEESNENTSKIEENAPIDSSVTVLDLGEFIIN